MKIWERNESKHIKEIFKRKKKKVDSLTKEDIKDFFYVFLNATTCIIIVLNFYVCYIFFLFSIFFYDQHQHFEKENILFYY